MMKYIVGCWPQTSGAPYFSIEFIEKDRVEAEYKMAEAEYKAGLDIPYFISPLTEMVEKGNLSPQVGDSFYPKSGWDGFPAEAPCWYRGGKLLQSNI